MSKSLDYDRFLSILFECKKSSLVAAIYYYILTLSYYIILRTLGSIFLNFLYHSKFSRLANPHFFSHFSVLN